MPHGLRGLVSIPLFSGLVTDAISERLSLPISIVSIPLFSGLVTDREALSVNKPRGVSIPLFSGLVTDRR